MSGRESRAFGGVILNQVAWKKRLCFEMLNHSVDRLDVVHDVYLK